MSGMREGRSPDMKKVVFLLSFRMSGHKALLKYALEVSLPRFERDLRDVQKQLDTMRIMLLRLQRQLHSRLQVQFSGASRATGV